MIKAVFFDWFHTLARFEPPREELHRRAYQEVGITPILIDRFDFYPEVSDCPRIRTLPELMPYL